MTVVEVPRSTRRGRTEERVEQGIMRRLYDDGETVYRVQWRIGGRRGAPTDHEQFDNLTDARRFRGALIANGYVRPAETPRVDESRVWVVQAWVRRYVATMTGVGPEYRRDTERMLDTYLVPVLGRLPMNAIRRSDAKELIRDLELQAGCKGCGRTKTAIRCRCGETARLAGREVECRRCATTWKPVCERCKRPGAGRLLSEKTVANIHSAISTCFEEARLDEKCDSNPFYKITLSRSDGSRERITWLLPEEFGLIVDCVQPGLARVGSDGRTRRLSAAQAARARALLVVLAGTGARYAEATAIAVDATTIDQEPSLYIGWAWVRDGLNGYVRVPIPKTERSRRALTIDRVVADALAPLVTGDLAYWDRSEDQVVFCNSAGKHWRNSNFHEYVWQPALDEAQRRGLTKNPTLHDLRHTHASWLLAAKWQLFDVSRRLGHKNISVTADLYGHLEVGADREALSVLGERWTAAGLIPSAPDSALDLSGT